MADAWTASRVLALAPDASAAKAGQGLARPGQWALLGRSEEALWGEIRGSGAEPYRVRVALDEPAFKCSCPSRKFPCKHGLGLLLILAAEPAALPQGEPPEWVEEWLRARGERAERKTLRLFTDLDAPESVDPAAQAKRREKREARIAEGLEQLSTWLADQARRGIAGLRGAPYSTFDLLAARLVDAQAPGLATRVRALAGIAVSGDGWEERMTAALASLTLIVAGYRAIDGLDPDAAADLREAIGWSREESELVGQAPVDDQWTVLGIRDIEDDRLVQERVWLRGQDSGMTALLLGFAPAHLRTPTSLAAGTSFTGRLAFYPGRPRQRAQLVERGAALPAAPPEWGGPADLLARHAEAIALRPWLGLSGGALSGVRLLPLRDGAGVWRVGDGVVALPLAGGAEEHWTLLALAGSEPFSVAGEWDGAAFLPLTAWIDGTPYVLHQRGPLAVPRCAA